MFERFLDAGQAHRPRRKATAAVAALAYSAAIAGVLLVEMWKIEKLRASYTPITFTVASSPQPRPAASEAAAPAVLPRPRKRHKPSERVQPTQPRPTPTVVAAVPSGRAPTPGDGDPNGLLGDDVAAGNSVVAPGPPGPVTVTTIEAQRISGTREIALPERTREQMSLTNVFRTSAAVRLCLSAHGEPTSVTVLKSTGYPEADRKIEREMWLWRYRPYQVNGQPLAVCTSIIFRYILE